MHEVALAQDLVNMLHNELDKRDISPAGKPLQVKVEVGAMSCVVIDSFEFAFQAVCRKTPLEKASLHCRERALEIECKNCGFGGKIDGEVPLCPDCESGQTEVTDGDEFLLKSIEIGE